MTRRAMLPASRPREAYELRAEMEQQLRTLVYAGDVTGAQALLDEMAMVFNDERIRHAKREAER